jgi:hypothetical protein
MIMDRQHFDALTATFAQSQSRRSTFRLLGAALLSAGGLGLLATESPARRKKKRRGGGGSGTGGGDQDGTGGGNQDGTGGGSGGKLPSGAPCESDTQCRNLLICEVPQNASNSDTECCGATGATCGGVNDDGDFLEPYCCIGEAGVRAFVCSESDPSNPFVPGTCLPAPPDEF